MKNLKFMAVLVAFVMLVVPTITILDNSENTDATAVSSTVTSTTGEFNIYFQVQSGITLPSSVTNNVDLTGIQSGWVGFTGEGYNAYLAVVDIMSDISMSSSTYSMDGAYTYTNSYGYPDINPEYGEITTLLDLSTTSTAQWYVYIYTNSSWSVGSDALGFYKSFVDYTVDSSTYKTANVALYYGTSAPAANTISVSTIKDFTPITDSNNNYLNIFAVDFTFIYPVNGVSTTVYETGYGSDAYTALMNALGNNLVGGNTFSAYGWYTSIYGLSTVQTAGAGTPDDWSDDVYVYWSLSVYNDSTDQYDYSDYTTGYYSPLSNAPLIGDDFEFVYA